jgi:hypothetical protein
MSQDDRLDLLAHCEHLRQQLTYAIDALEGLPTMGWNTNSARDVLGEFDPSAADCRGAVSEILLLRRWIDRDARNCPSSTDVDEFLALSMSRLPDSGGQ